MYYNITIEKLNHQGKGISHINNKIIFVKNTNIGDEVKVKITKETKKYLEGEVVRYIKQKPTNIICPYYYQCGGCHISMMSYQEQLIFKKEKVENILNKYAHINNKVDIIPSTNQYNYRNKVTYHVQNNQLGFYQEHTNNLIPLTDCLLLLPQIKNIACIIQQKINLSNVTKVVIKEHDNNIMVNIEGNIDKPKVINILSDKVKTIINNNKVIYGDGYLFQTIDNYKFKVSWTSFFQVNIDVMQKLYQTILKLSNLTKKDKVIDLYCGTGTIGIYLSKHCQEVLGIEINKQAIEDANSNKKTNNIQNIKFISGDVKKIINNHYQANTIIVDPPRKGLDNYTIETIKKITPKKIIYVSCDPITLARDLNKLQIQYNIDKVIAFDMFPETYHVECVCLLNLHKTFIK